MAVCDLRRSSITYIASKWSGFGMPVLGKSAVHRLCAKRCARVAYLRLTSCSFKSARTRSVVRSSVFCSWLSAVPATAPWLAKTRRRRPLSSDLSEGTVAAAALSQPLNLATLFRHTAFIMARPLCSWRNIEQTTSLVLAARPCRCPYRHKKSDQPTSASLTQASYRHSPSPEQWSHCALAARNLAEKLARNACSSL